MSKELGRKGYTISLDPKVWEDWRTRAAAAGLSTSRWVEWIMIAALKRSVPLELPHSLVAPATALDNIKAVSPPALTALHEITRAAATALDNIKAVSPPALTALHEITRAAVAEHKADLATTAPAPALSARELGLAVPDFLRRDCVPPADDQERSAGGPPRLATAFVPAVTVAPTQNKSSRTVSSPQPAVFQAPASEGRNPVQDAAAQAEKDAKQAAYIAATFPVPPGYERLPFNCVMIDGMQYALAYHSRPMPPPREGRYLKAADGNGVVWYLEYYRPDDDRYQGTEEGCSQGQVWWAAIMDAKFKPDPAFIDNTTDDDAISDDE